VATSWSRVVCLLSGLGSFHTERGITQ